MIQLVNLVVFILDKHLGGYTLKEGFFGKIFKVNLGRWEKALLEDG